MEDLVLSSGRPDSEVSFKDAIENYRRNTDWWIVYDILDLPSSKGSALWISNKSGIAIDTVTEALEGMVVLGLLRQTAKGFEKIQNAIFPEVPESSKLKKMSEHALISRQILNHLNDSCEGALRYSSFASNASVIANLFQKIDQAFSEAEEESRELPQAELVDVYLLSFTATTALPKA